VCRGVVVIVVVVGGGGGGGAAAAAAAAVAGGSDVILQKFVSYLVASLVCKMCIFAFGDGHVFNAIGGHI
jgi:hypothetical protein